MAVKRSPSRIARTVVATLCPECDGDLEIIGHRKTKGGGISTHSPTPTAPARDGVETLGVAMSARIQKRREGYTYTPAHGGVMVFVAAFDEPSGLADATRT